MTLDTGAARFVSGLVAGLTVLPLHQHGTENVALVCWKSGTRFNAHRHWGGEEIFVIEGTFADEHGIYPAGSWLRNPHLSTHSPFTDEGCLIYVKTGHLGSVGEPGGQLVPTPGDVGLSGYDVAHLAMNVLDHRVRPFRTPFLSITTNIAQKKHD